MKSKILSFVTAAVCSLIFAGPAAAADDLAAIKKVLQQIAPGAKPDRIAESPLPGLYEVSIGPDVLYVSKDGRYVVQGDLINLATQQNLTETQRGQGRMQLLRGLDEKGMIVFPAKGKAKHTVTVFTDIDCGYCRKLQSQIKEYNQAGITVRYLAFPRSGADTPSFHKAANVWCAKDRRAALTRAMNGEQVDSKSCDNPVNAHLAMAERLGVNGTPTMVLEDGTMVPGYMPPDRLRQALDQIAAAR